MLKTTVLLQSYRTSTYFSGCILAVIRSAHYCFKPAILRLNCWWRCCWDARSRTSTRACVTAQQV